MPRVIKYMALWEWEEVEQVAPDVPLDDGSEDEGEDEGEGQEGGE